MAGRPAESSLREAFSAFFHRWHIKHQEFLEKLLDFAGNEDECRDIVAQMLAHYQDLFQEKSKAANEDVFLVMSAPWFSSFERTLIWISDFKSSMLFPLIKNSVGKELSADQEEKIELIRTETRREEKAIEEELAKVQESVAGNAIFSLVRRFEGLVDGEISELDTALEELKAAMLVVVEEADVLRGSTMKKLIELLNPMQNLKFLTATAQFVARARRWGVYKDSLMTTSSADASTSHA